MYHLWHINFSRFQKASITHVSFVTFQFYRFQKASITHVSFVTYQFLQILKSINYPCTICDISISADFKKHQLPMYNLWHFNSTDFKKHQLPMYHLWHIYFYRFQKASITHVQFVTYQFLTISKGINYPCIICDIIICKELKKHQLPISHLWPTSVSCRDAIASKNVKMW